MKKIHRSFPTAILLSPLIFLLSPELIPICEAVWLNIPHTGSKCVSEEIETNVVVLRRALSVCIYNSGTYLACFEAEGKSHGNKDISINIDWKTEIAAKDWDSITRKKKIEGVELEITKLDAVVEAIHENLLYLRNREAEMRIVSEKTNSRVPWYSIISLGICIVVSDLQILYLKQYFEKKKLI